MIANEPGFDELCQSLRSWCGVTITPSKAYLVHSRLRTLMRQVKSSNLHQLLQQAQGPQGSAVRDKIIDALTTHETLFFRDLAPFEALGKHVVPERQQLAGSKRPSLRIWSAACSTGQEPYSIAMTLLETIADIDRWDISILATDVSSASIEQAMVGVYQDHEVQRGSNERHRNRFFRRVSDGWQIRDTVKRLVSFEVRNLLDTQQPNGPFDVIFCRNVVIYFSGDDPARTYRMLTSRLSPSGRLFVGCSEVLLGLSDCLTRDRIGTASCYRRVTC